jgi:hypothetical protein
MIRKLKTGEYRLYSRKKNPKTGKREILGPSQRVRLRKNTKEKFNTSKDNDIHDQGNDGLKWMITIRK